MQAEGRRQMFDRWQLMSDGEVNELDIAERSGEAVRTVIEPVERKTVGEVAISLVPRPPGDPGGL
jgi:hypothetical protein